MGNREYEHLPVYIAVQVSAERWRIAQLIVREDANGWHFPCYAFVTKALSEGKCNNALTDLQRQTEDAVAARTAL